MRLAVAASALLLLLSPATALGQDVPTGRLPRNVVPSHVGLELKIDPRLERFSGVVTMDLDVAEATNVIWLHGRDLTITSAQISAGKSRAQPLTSTLADPSGVLKFTAANAIPAGKAKLEIRYEAPFAANEGAYRVKPEGIDYVLSDMEPTEARKAYPVFDEPSFKQPWTMTLVIPAGMQGVSNTREVSRKTFSNGWQQLRFATTENLPSYLIAFAVGPWDIVEAADIPPNAVRKTPLKLRGIAAKGQGVKMKYVLANTAKILAAEEAYFGTPYPFDKLDLVAAPDFTAGAMENPGLIVYRDSVLFTDEQSTIGARKYLWDAHTHELAHQWFGNLVTMPWWDDLWLNESFASWFASRIVAEVNPGLHPERSQVESGLYAMNGDSLATTRRIREPILTFTDIQSGFDGITYSKGGAVLAMFERQLGADKFREGMRQYMAKHARGNATSDDLIEALAAVSADPDTFRKSFRGFLDQPGVPLLQVRAECNDGPPRLVIKQQRYLPVGSTVAASGEWVVPMCVRYGDEAGLHTQCNLVSGREAVLPLETTACPAFVMPNADGAGYYRFSLDAHGQAEVQANFNQLNEHEQRAFADSISAAYVAGTIDTPAFLRAAADLAKAPLASTALSPVSRINWLIDRVATTEEQKQKLRDMLRTWYAPRLTALGTSPQDGESDDTRLLRSGLIATLATTARLPGLRAALAAQGRTMLGLSVAGKPGDGKLHPDAAWVEERGLALALAMELGDAEVFDALLRHFEASNDPVIRRQLLSAAGQAKQPELAARARNYALKPSVRRNEVGSLINLDSGDRTGWPEARQWMVDNFPAISAKLGNGSGIARLYASHMCSPAEARQLSATWTERLKDVEGGPRALAQTVESIKLCAALKARHEGGLR